MSFGAVQLTNAGRQLLTQALAGGSLHFTKMQMGSGKLTTQAIPDLTALILPVKEVPLSTITQNGEYVSIQGTFSNQGLEAGFWWREIGLFAKAGKDKCLQLEGSNFRLGGIAPISRAVPSFRVSMRPAVSVAWQKGN